VRNPYAAFFVLLFFCFVIFFILALLTAFHFVFEGQQQSSIASQPMFS